MKSQYTDKHLAVLSVNVMMSSRKLPLAFTGHCLLQQCIVFLQIEDSFL